MATRTVTVRSREGLGIDTRELHDFVRGLKKANPVLRRSLRRRLRGAGEIVAAEARAIASRDSKSVPPTIKVRTAGASVMVVAGGEGVPLARLLELGNTGGAKSASATRSGRFRHPVYGQRNVWVSQDMHPFLMPAAAANIGRVEAEALAAVDEAIQALVRAG